MTDSNTNTRILIKTVCIKVRFMARNTAEDRRSLTLSFQNTSTKIKLYNRKPFKLPDEGVLLCFCILLSEKKKPWKEKIYQTTS